MWTKEHDVANIPHIIARQGLTPLASLLTHTKKRWSYRWHGGRYFRDIRLNFVMHDAQFVPLRSMESVDV
jgi:hypothetical protein